MVNSLLHSALIECEKECPEFKKEILPYELKINWVTNESDIGAIHSGKKIIVYVHDYTDEAKQSIMTIHHYVKIGFAEKAKYYMTDHAKTATNILATSKIAQYSKPYIYEYFNNSFKIDLFNKTPAIVYAYDKLKSIDEQGLFVSIYLKEMIKYTSEVYPSNSPIANKTVADFTDFIYKIAKRGTLPYEERFHADTLFTANTISIRIVLANSAEASNIEPRMLQLNNDIIHNKAKTFYILGSGENVPLAEAITDKFCEEHGGVLNEPQVIRYKRRGKWTSDAIAHIISRNN